MRGKPAKALTAAALANANKAWAPDALKEVELFDADVAKAVAASNTPIDRLSPMIKGEHCAFFKG